MKKFKKKPEIEEAANKVYLAAVDIPRGEFMPFDWIVQQGGYSRIASEWTTFAKYLRKRFRLERGIVLWCPEPNKGFKLATTVEQIVLLNDKRQLKAMRQLHKSNDALVVVKSAELEVHQQTTRWARVERNRRSLKEIRRNRKLDRLLG